VYKKVEFGRNMHETRMEKLVRQPQTVNKCQSFEQHFKH